MPIKNEKIVENKIKVGVEEFDAFETRFLKRVNLQWPEKDKIDMADFVIHNNSSKNELKKEAENIYKKIL